MQINRMASRTSRAKADWCDRWAFVSYLQSETDRIGDRSLSDLPSIATLRLVEQAFDNAFPCPATMTAFWEEVRGMSWPERAGESPWQDLSAMAYDLSVHGTTAPLAIQSGRVCSPILQHLRDRAAIIFSADRPGIAFVYQEEVKDGIWTSTPLWAASINDIKNGVDSGWSHGRSRWAASIGVDGEESQFLCGLDRKGLPLKSVDVQLIVSATVVGFDLPRLRADEVTSDMASETARSRSLDSRPGQA